MNSRSKGARGEREAAKYIAEHGFSARRGVQYQGSKDSPDVCHDIPGVHIEVKRTEKFRVYDSIEQACRDAGDKIPVVLHKRNRGEWLVVIRADDFMALIKERTKP